MSDFKSNLNDLSTEHGYRFEFRCGKCGRSRKSALIPHQSASGAPGGGGFLTRIFGGNAAASKPQPSAAGDEAIAVATSELRPHFSHCGGCSAWVCVESCWDAAAKSCPDCKPAHAPAVVKAAPQPAEPVKAKAPQPAIPPLNRTTCPHCGGRVDKARLCAKCGNLLEVSAKKCIRCPHVVPAGAKFCLKCGTKQ